MPVVKTFRELLRKQRGLREMTQEELANAIGVRQNTISAWEYGKAHPHPETLEETIRILAVNFKLHPEQIKATLPENFREPRWKPRHPLGRLVRKCRHEQGMSIRAFAEKWEVGEDVIYRMEWTGRVIPLCSIPFWSEALGRDPRWLQENFTRRSPFEVSSPSGLPQFIREQRMARGLSQKKFAELLGVFVQEVSRMETDPSFGFRGKKLTVEKVAEALQVPEHELRDRIPPRKHWTARRPSGNTPPETICGGIQEQVLSFRGAW